MPWLIAAAILLIPASLTAEPHHAPASSRIVVRWYGDLLTSRDVAAAQELAGRILRQAGIEVSWLDCWSSPAACPQPTRSNEFILRTMRAADGAVAARRGVLGFSLIDVSAAEGAIATVLTDRVTSLAENAAVDRVDLLGRTAAHEIGHLLLGNTRHGANGLMRSFWTISELRRNIAGDWRFSDQEAESMRQGIALARSRDARDARHALETQDSRTDGAGGTGERTAQAGGAE